MNARRFALGAVALLFAVAAPSAMGPSPLLSLRAVAAPGGAQLRAFGSRSAAQVHSVTGAKLDGALADLSRHLGAVTADHALADLHNLSPAARFRQPASGSTPEVLVDIVTRGDAQQLKEALVALGLERPSVYLNDVGGWLPVTQIDAAAAIAEVHSLRAAMPRRRAAVATQGDFAERSDTLRATYSSLTGSGVTVGVLSDSFDCYAKYAATGSGVPVSGVRGYASNGFTADAAADEASGALPSTVKVLAEADCLNYGAPELLPFTDEGRAMLQIVHVVAPGAALVFYTGDNSEADFANGIHQLAAAGAKVIADDVGYFDEPFFQDGLIAQAIDAVNAQGVAYFSAAGNDARYAYDNTSPSFVTLSSTAPTSGEHLLNFDTSNNSNATMLPVTIPALFPGEYVGVVLEWDQPFVTGAPGSGGATSHLDLCVSGASGTDIVENLASTPVTCSGTTPASADPYSTGPDPVQVLIIGNPASNNVNSAPQTINIMVGLASGSVPPGRLKLAVLGDGAQTIIEAALATNGGTIQGHPGAAGAFAVGAAAYYETPRCGSVSTTVLEPFSSSGGTPILFDVNGSRLSTPTVRQKPDAVGPDGVNNTFIGFTLASDNITLGTTVSQCQTNAALPNFFGSSAATPHAAGIAALMLQANSAVTPAQIYAALQKSALPMGGSTPNYDSGYGFIQADAALGRVPLATPTLSIGSSSIQAGTSTTLSWSSIGATGCTASGSWSGALASSGTQTITPTTAGTNNYSLACTNAAGSSPAASVGLTVTAAPSSGHGGGRVDLVLLLGLAAALGARRIAGARRLQ